MIIEFFGLSRTGKTTLRNELLKKDYKTIGDTSDIIKSFYFSKFLIKNPLKTFYLFYKLNSNYLKLEKFSIINYLKMFFMRNSYLAGVLSKYERAIDLRKKEKGKILGDEFSLQSIFMILQKRASEKEIRKLLSLLPKPDTLYVLEIDDKIRYERYKKTRFPAQWVEEEYAKNWMSNSEFNYKIIKELLMDNLYIPKTKIKLINLNNINNKIDF